MMMKKPGLMIVMIVLLALTGCTLPTANTRIKPQLEIVDEDQGWVKVRITDVPSAGYMLHWGDVDTGYGVCAVYPEQEIYEHFYQEVPGPRLGEQIPTDYDITLVDEQGRPVAQAPVHVDSVHCHLSLVSMEGREVTVRYWGRFGIDYSIDWGDGSTTHITVGPTATGLETHTYNAPGTFFLSMEEIFSPRQVFFDITVE